ncbi:hypothetical protein [Spiroplasma endosymbiont of Amphimallon solstitiale]|uniref:hypothetical protein n=2 Tax=unclassified Spiroplasma TaxID=2637901 RepID=UPI00313BA9A1
MFKILYTLVTISLATFTNLSQVKINNYHHKEIKSENTILNEQSLTLAFESGNFYNWNENDSTNSIAGIFTNSQAQSYLLNKDGTYNNLDLQISNFIRFDDNLGIATLNNFHKSDDSNFINNSFLMTKNGISDDATAIETPNHTFTNFGNNIVSTDIGADLINTDGKVTNLVIPYHYGKGKTSFTTINATFGVFVGGDQNSYILKVDGNIKPININVPNPILLNSFVAINDNGGIIRDVNGQLFYLTIDDNGNATTKPLIINKEPLFSTTTVFFSKTGNNQGILNVNLKNSSKFFGQPYHLSITDSNDIKLTKINEHYMNNFILLHDGLGVFIDEQEIGYFVNELGTFTKIGYCANFQRINDNLGFINKKTSKLLLSDSKNNNWSRINTIKFTKTKDEQLTNFINSYIDKDKLTAVNRTNNWISNNNLILNVTNDELKDITINDNQPLLPNINNSITTIINSNSEINIKFKDEIITYHVLIYNQNILPTLDNSTNTNIKYVGIVNNNLYDINSTNTNDGFTINFNYDNTIQFVNIITIDSTTMNKMNLWTLKPKTTFKLNAKSNNNVYLLQTVNWNNISNWQYFTIYHGNNLPIIEFWTTDAGIKLWNAALKLNFTSKKLENMNATEINNLRNLSVNWTINEARGNTLGYIISGFLSIGFILTIIAIIYDWYLKQQFKKKQSNTKTNVN